MKRVEGAFLALVAPQAPFPRLVAAQALPAVEESFGRLYDVLPPAAYVSGLISNDHRVGFLIANSALVGFGVWCWLVPIRRRKPSAVPLAWFWVVLESANA